ncbi:MAG: PepSY-associated TM helix domain-containing protein [Phenylobacterium sp.]|uniref:PepSY-associated TM helix domain-containing protein n=1 Tax=Phenylobacterium sp. TaxID=1871053 RepID=UPI00391BB349
MGLVRTLHAWAGATVSLLLMLMGLSGAFLVFEDDWVRLSVPGADQPAQTQPAALGAAAEAVEARHPGAVRSLAFGGPHLGVHRVRFAGPKGEYVRPDGGVAAAWTGLGRPEVAVFELHHRLLSGKTGETVVGVGGLCLVLLAITGFIAWVPARRSFAWRLWPGGTGRRDLLAAHRDVGLMFCAPLLVMGATGAAMIFDQAARGVLTGLAPGPAPASAKVEARAGDVDWPRALAAAQARFPDAQIRIIAWPAKPGAPASVRLKRPGEWHPNGRTLVLVDPATSAVLRAEDAQAWGLGLRIYNGLYPVHSAAVGGRAYDAVIAATGLALASLGGFGLWSFLIKPRRRRRRAKGAAAT